MSDAKRYRLPEALGGGEYEEHWRADGSTEAPMGTVAFLENGALFCVARTLLTEVKPPMPPEPPVGSLVHLASYYGVYERLDRGWASTNKGGAYGWGELLLLNSGDTPVRLVPDPFAESIELPWKSDDTAQAVGVSAGDLERNGLVYVETEDYTLCVPRRHVRAMARALWAAVDGEKKATP